MSIHKDGGGRTWAGYTGTETRRQAETGSDVRSRGQEAIRRSRKQTKRGLLERLAQAEVNRQMSAEIDQFEAQWGKAE